MENITNNVSHIERPMVSQNHVPEKWEDSQFYKFAKHEYELMEQRWNEAYSKESNSGKRDGMNRDKEYGDLVHNAVLALLKLFYEQGHSGMSAGFTLAEFRRLANFKPLTPLTGEDGEWMDAFTDHNGKTIQQNRRCYSIFREKGDNSTAENSEGVIFSDDEGKTWYTNAHSRIKITFPYVIKDEIDRKILSKDEKDAMQKEDEEEWNRFVKEHPEQAAMLNRRNNISQNTTVNSN